MHNCIITKRALSPRLKIPQTGGRAEKKDLKGRKRGSCAPLEHGTRPISSHPWSPNLSWGPRFDVLFTCGGDCSWAAVTAVISLVQSPAPVPQDFVQLSAPPIPCLKLFSNSPGHIKASGSKSWSPRGLPGVVPGQIVPWDQTELARNLSKSQASRRHTPASLGNMSPSTVMTTPYMNVQRSFSPWSHLVIKFPTPRVLNRLPTTEEEFAQR